MDIEEAKATYTELKKEDGAYKVSYRRYSKGNQWTEIGLKFNRSDAERLQNLIAKGCLRSDRETLAILSSI